MARCVASLALLICVGSVAAVEFLAKPSESLSDGHAELRSAFADMMKDDDDDDADLFEQRSAGSSLLQAKTSSDEPLDAYMEDSANALSGALGERWNGKQLEKNAKQQTNALLQGIR